MQPSSFSAPCVDPISDKRESKYFAKWKCAGEKEDQERMNDEIKVTTSNA